MRSSIKASASWIRIGVSTVWTMLLLALGIAAIFSFVPLRDKTPTITVDGPYVPQPWEIPLGVVLLLSVVPILLVVLRWQRRMTGELARAGAEWQLLRGEASATATATATAP